MTDVAYRKIKTAILDGALSPGLLASEQQIAAHLAMSRTPVHQAVARLEQDGWIELLPRRGLRIAPISESDMYNVYEALLALEMTAVYRLASKDGPEIEQAIALLETICQEGEDALAARDLWRWAGADAKFHTLLVDLSGNQHVARLARSVLEHAQRARQITLKLRPFPTASNDDHRAILQAIRNGAKDQARDLMQAHRLRGMAVLLPIVGALPPTTAFGTSG